MDCLAWVRRYADQGVHSVSRSCCSVSSMICIVYLMFDVIYCSKCVRSTSIVHPLAMLALCGHVIDWESATHTAGVPIDSDDEEREV